MAKEFNIEDHITGTFGVVGKNYFSVYFFFEDMSKIHTPIPIVIGIDSPDAAVELAYKLDKLLEDFSKKYSESNYQN